MKACPLIGEVSASGMGRDQRDRSPSSREEVPPGHASRRRASARDPRGSGRSGGDGRSQSQGPRSRRRGGSRASGNRPGPPSRSRATRSGFGTDSGPGATGLDRETDALANPLADPATTGDGIGWMGSVIPLRSWLHYRIFRRDDRSDYLEVYSKRITRIGSAPTMTAGDRKSVV